MNKPKDSLRPQKNSQNGSEPGGGEKSIGLALGSGGARGLAHIGVINALREEKIAIDYIAGSSIGALIGASLASDDIRQLQEFVLKLNWKVMASYVDFVFPQKGLMEGSRVRDLIDELLPIKKFTGLSKPFIAVATNIRTGEEIDLDEGDLIDAIRASISLPGIMNPHRVGNEYLVDGGLVNPVPVDVVRRMGADVVLAVDLNNDLISRNGRKKKVFRTRRKLKARAETAEEVETPKPAWVPKPLEDRYRLLEQSVKKSISDWLEDEPEDQQREPNIFDVMVNSINIMEYQVTQSNLRKFPPDVLIKPKLGHLNLFDYDEAEATIREGYELTMHHMDHIKRLISLPEKQQ